MAAIMPATALVTRAMPALADGNDAQSAGWTGYTNSGGVGYSSVYLYGGPSSQGAVLASVPVNQAVTVAGYAAGETLAPANPIWYSVVTSQGSGWMYSGLVSRIPPVLQPAAAVAPPPGPLPAAIGNGRSIGISLSRQHLWAYDGGNVAWQADVTTGAPDKPTPPGLYAIQRKIPFFKFVSPWAPTSPFWYPDSPTHYALQFRSDGFYIHDAPWRPYYGPGTNLPHMDPDGTVRAGSHGCVNTQLDTIEFLAPWTPIGAPVNIIA